MLTTVSSQIITLLLHLLIWVHFSDAYFKSKRNPMKQNYDPYARLSLDQAQGTPSQVNGISSGGVQGAGASGAGALGTPTQVNGNSGSGTQDTGASGAVALGAGDPGTLTQVDNTLGGGAQGAGSSSAGAPDTPTQVNGISGSGTQGAGASGAGASGAGASGADASGAGATGTPTQVNDISGAGTQVAGASGAGASGAGATGTLSQVKGISGFSTQGAGASGAGASGAGASGTGGTGTATQVNGISGGGTEDAGASGAGASGAGASGAGATGTPTQVNGISGGGTQVSGASGTGAPGTPTQVNNALDGGAQGAVASGAGALSTPTQVNGNSGSGTQGTSVSGAGAPGTPTQVNGISDGGTQGAGASGAGAPATTTQVNGTSGGDTQGAGASGAGATGTPSQVNGISGGGTQGAGASGAGASGAGASGADASSAGASGAGAPGTTTQVNGTSGGDTQGAGASGVGATGTPTQVNGALDAGAPATNNTHSNTPIPVSPAATTTPPYTSGSNTTSKPPKPVSTTGCVIKGNKLKNGENVTLDCSTFLCKEGKVYGTDLASNPNMCGRCDLYQNLNIKTFDNVDLEWRGRCQYKVVEQRVDKGLTEDFGVNIRLKNCDAHTKDTTACIYALEVWDGEKNKALLLDILLDSTSYHNLITNKTIEVKSSEVIFDEDWMVWVPTDGGIRIHGPTNIAIEYNHNRVHIWIPSSLKSGVNGICGTYDQHQSQDLVHRETGKVPENLFEYFKSWEKSECEPHNLQTQNPLLSATPAGVEKIERDCKLIVIKAQLEVKFVVMAEREERLTDNCVRDMFALTEEKKERHYEVHQKLLVQILKVWKRACISAGNFITTSSGIVHEESIATASGVTGCKSNEICINSGGQCQRSKCIGEIITGGCDGATCICCKVKVNQAPNKTQATNAPDTGEKPQSANASGAGAATGNGNGSDIINDTSSEEAPKGTISDPNIVTQVPTKTQAIDAPDTGEKPQSANASVAGSATGNGNGADIINDTGAEDAPKGTIVNPNIDSRTLLPDETRYDDIYNQKNDRIPLHQNEFGSVNFANEGLKNRNSRYFSPRNYGINEIPSPESIYSGNFALSQYEPSFGTHKAFNTQLGNAVRSDKMARKENDLRPSPMAVDREMNLLSLEESSLGEYMPFNSLLEDAVRSAALAREETYLRPSPFHNEIRPTLIESDNRLNDNHFNARRGRALTSQLGQSTFPETPESGNQRSLYHQIGNRTLYNLNYVDNNSLTAKMNVNNEKNKPILKQSLDKVNTNHSISGENNADPQNGLSSLKTKNVNNITDNTLSSQLHDTLVLNISFKNEMKNSTQEDMSVSSFYFNEANKPEDAIPIKNVEKKLLPINYTFNEANLKNMILNNQLENAVRIDTMAPQLKIQEDTFDILIPEADKTVSRHTGEIGRGQNECQQLLKCNPNVGTKVCGSDGRSYNNNCTLSILACMHPTLNLKKTYDGVC